MKRISSIFTAVIAVSILCAGSAGAFQTTTGNIPIGQLDPWPATAATEVVQFEARVGNHATDGDWELGHSFAENFQRYYLDTSGQAAWLTDVNNKFTLTHDSSTGDFTLETTVCTDNLAPDCAPSSIISTTWQSGRKCQKVNEIWLMVKSGAEAYTMVAKKLVLNDQSINGPSGNLSITNRGTEDRKYLKIYGESFENFTMTGEMTFNWGTYTPNADDLALFMSVIFEDTEAVLDPDGDGYGIGAYPAYCDCNNGDDTVYPGAPEICDGKDNNCDDSTDEDFTLLGNSCDGNDTDLCANGTYTCNLDGTGVECTNETITNIAEVCNGLDDDCDGTPDNGVADIVTGTDTGECQVGIQSCINGAFTETQAEISPAAESCDGADNDCDGTPDNDVADIVTGTDTGECQVGIQSCINGAFTETQAEIGPAAESCNGNDDDCDGTPDNGVADIVTGTDTGECQVGIQSCINGAFTEIQAEIGPVPEVCDGADNDCDGNIPLDEEDFDEDQYVECTLVNGGWAGVIGGGDCDDLDAASFPGNVEECDGADNDCDGTADNNVADIVTGSDVGECQPEIQSCVGGTFTITQTEIGPSPEICGDGLDQNCNDIADEDCAPALVESVGGGSGDTIQEVYNFVAPQGTDIIRMQGIVFPESLTFDRDVNVTFVGGFDDLFTASTGWTTIDGSVTISKGKVTVEYLIIM